MREFIGGGGVRLAASVAGNEQDVPVLLLHGGGQTRHAWRASVTALAAAGFYAVAIDLRGHGDSEWPQDHDYGIDAQIADLRAVIAELPEPPVVVGASMGGIIAMTTLGESPVGLARALVLVDVTPEVDADGRARVIGFMQANPEGFASLDEAAEVIAAYLPHRPRPTSSDGLRRNLRLGNDGRYRWHWDPRFFDTFEVDVKSSQARYVAAARHLDLPVLLVRGGRSELVKPEQVRRFIELIPHAESVDVLDAAHMIAGDDNDAFNTALMAFLQQRIR